MFRTPRAHLSYRLLQTFAAAAVVQLCCVITAADSPAGDGTATIGPHPQVPAAAPTDRPETAGAWAATLGVPTQAIQQLPLGCTANWGPPPTAPHPALGQTIREPTGPAAGGSAPSNRPASDAASVCGFKQSAFSLAPHASLPSAYQQQLRSLRVAPPASRTATPRIGTAATRLDRPPNGGTDDSLLADPLPAPSGGAEQDLLQSQDALLDKDPLSTLDPLSDVGPAEERDRREQPDASAEQPDPHEALFLESLYPSAAACGKCHPDHYDQWRGSAHAYSAISPMFNAFEQTITELSKGTVGYFCVRCHAPVAVQAEMPRDASILEAPRVLREGITCIACHRVREYSGTTNGQRRIAPGDIHEPVSSAGTGEGIAAAIDQKDRHALKTSAAEDNPGQAIHRGRFFFEPLSQSGFCAPCHQVAVHPGIDLEIVWAQYRNSPAAERGVHCQDCHMGAVPGKPLGFRQAHIATLSEKPFGEPRKQSNHSFWGPGSSIAHPGLFPQNEKADRWSPRQWLLFDWRSGWGTPEFERQPAGPFPPPWDNADERRDARRVLDENLDRLAEKRAAATATMEHAIRLEPRWLTTPRVGQPFGFEVEVHNESDGHNLPTGSLGAQPQLWLNLALRNPRGQIVWQSGDLDDYGDLRDLNSYQVTRGERPRDAQLFNLQTKFLITGVKGPDREIPLPINVDIDQVPLLRPGAVPVSVLNHPPFIRMEARSIAPQGSRTALYQIPADRLAMPGVYRLSIRMRSRMEPPYFMRFCNASDEMIRRMLEETLDIHARTFEIVVH